MDNQFDLQPPQSKRAIAARSQFYKILSGVFVYPSDEAKKDYIRRGAGEALRELAADLPFAIPAIGSLALVDEASDIDATYTGLFDNCGGRPALSLHEKDYSRTDTKQVWEELIRYYEHFGLNYDLKGNKEWPDHMGVELEFLHYLTFLETGSPDDLASMYATAEGDFLERHLAKWVPQFAEKLIGMAQDSPYASLARVLAQFIEGEMEFNRGRRLLQ